MPGERTVTEPNVREWTLHDVPEQKRGYAAVLGALSGPAVRRGSSEAALSKADVGQVLYDSLIEEVPFTNPDRRAGWEAACGFIAGKLGVDVPTGGEQA